MLCNVIMSHSLLDQTRHIPSTNIFVWKPEYQTEEYQTIESTHTQPSPVSVGVRKKIRFLPKLAD